MSLVFKEDFGIMANRKRIAAAISLILVVAFVLTMTACGGGGGGAAGVVNDFFDAIEKHDVKKFLNCFEKEKREDIQDLYDDDKIEEQLEMLDEMYKAYGGKNWRKKIKVGKAEEVDKDGGITYYEVEVEFNGEEDYIDVVKVKGKYYIDDGFIY